MISKVAIIPASLATSLSPAFSYCEAKSWRSDLLRTLSLNPIKYILLVMASLTMTFVLFGGSILRIWLFVAFARHSTMLFRALAFFVHAFAYVPFAAVNGLGHPEWKAKLDLAQTPLFMALCWVLTLKIGLVGAALSKLAFWVIDFGCLFAMSKKLVGFLLTDAASSALVKSFAVATIPVIGSLLLFPANVPLNLNLALFFAVLILYAFATWQVAFDDQDRLVISASPQTLVPRKVV